VNQKNKLDSLIGNNEYSQGLYDQASLLITEPDRLMTVSINTDDYLFSIGSAGVMVYFVWLVLLAVIILLAIKMFKYRATAIEVEKDMSIKAREQKESDSNSPCIIIRYDRGGHHTFINPVFEKFTGLSADEIQGKTIKEVSDIFSGFATDSQTWSKKIESVMATGVAEEWTSNYKGKSGSYHFLISLTKEFDYEKREDSVLVTVKDITSEKQQEETTEECEKRFIDLVINNPGIAVTGFDEEGKIIFWNKASARLYGYSDKEALDKNITDLIIHPDDKDRFLKDFQKLKEKGKAKKGEKATRCDKKGSELEVYTEYLKTEGINGKAEFYAFDLNLSSLKDSSDFNKKNIIRLFDHIEEIIFVSDPKTGKIFYKNDYTNKLVESSKEKSSWYKSLKEDKDPLITKNKKVTLPTEGSPLKWEHTDKELNRHFLIVEKLIDWDGDKKEKLTMIMDISPIKKSETSLEEEGFLYSTLESIGEGVIASDTNGKVTLMNKAAEELTGWTATEAEGKPIEEVMVIIDEKSGEPADKSILQMIETNTAIGIVNNPVMVAKDGIKKSLYINGAPIYSKKNEILGDIIVFHDITPKKRMEDELIKSQKLESLGTLAAGIAYDFNNLLSSLFGYIEMAMVFHNSKEKVAQYLSRALGIYERATGLTDKLITFSRRGTPETKTTSIEEILDEAAQYALSGSKVRYKLELDPELWLCDVDKSQIMQVFNNLMLNAVQAMPDGGIITIKGENVPGSDAPEWTGKTSNYIKISIIDKGTGIPETYLERIFDPFFTIKQ
jgi:PAS domain S-box-containing protein